MIAQPLQKFHCHLIMSYSSTGLSQVWVGGTEVGSPASVWVWYPSDVEIPLNPPAGKWNEDEPMGGNCLNYKQGGWNARGCHNEFPSVCVIDLASQIQRHICCVINSASQILRHRSCVIDIVSQILRHIYCVIKYCLAMGRICSRDLKTCVSN